MGPTALVLGMLLLYVFVRRELNHPLFGLVAMTLFGVTSVYQQAVFWFAASFSVLALDTLLLALLAAQRWRRTGRPLDLGLAVLGAGLAPAWFASGVLAGPVVALYLLPWGKEEWKRPMAWLAMIAPLLGTAGFLAVSLPRTAPVIMNLEHYEGKSPFEKFNVGEGAVRTSRSVVDNLLPGQVGFGGVGVSLPLPATALALELLAVAGWWWWRGADDFRLLLLGVGLIVSSYLLVYSARAAWGYDGVMTTNAWSRYHLLPQLGLTLFVAGGLPGRGFDRHGVGLTRRQVRGVAILIGLCFLFQLPRGIAAYFGPLPELTATLRRIEEVDARCRQYHISGDAARAALPPLPFPEVLVTRVSGWAFLWGSSEPRELSPEEIRRLLDT
jgi:hypothetical protein